MRPGGGVQLGGNEWGGKKRGGFLTILVDAVYASKCQSHAPAAACLTRLQGRKESAAVWRSFTPGAGKGARKKLIFFVGRAWPVHVVQVQGCC